MARVTDIINAISEGTGQTYTRLSEARRDFFGAAYCGLPDANIRGGSYDEIQAISTLVNGNTFHRLSDQYINLGANYAVSTSETKRSGEIKNEIYTCKLL